MKTKSNINHKDSFRRIFVANFVGGIGWIAGATIGFSVLAYVLGLVLSWLKVTPFLGNWLAELIVTTQEALSKQIMIQ